MFVLFITIAIYKTFAVTIAAAAAAADVEIIVSNAKRKTSQKLFFFFVVFVQLLAHFPGFPNFNPKSKKRFLFSPHFYLKFFSVLSLSL